MEDEGLSCVLLFSLSYLLLPCVSGLLSQSLLYM